MAFGLMGNIGEGDCTPNSLVLGTGLQSPCFDMKTWWEAGGHGLRLCLCGLLIGLIGNRCGKAGGWAASQSSWEKLKTTAFLETGGITVRGGVGGEERETEGEFLGLCGH